ncbi:folliculin-like [Acanthaster planci]|uniref:Folliculin n=1 Tax=Acanthaster planci TaxID=133434 RepID=A0A8B7YQM1_ACAPL|nr:folliculin-like [Acanthaster planci]XP_022095569.1 folliculin-like [Acanthaster planci]
MNAVVSLCHFCELHGPSILFCTQSFHTNEEGQQTFDNNSGASGSSGHPLFRRSRSTDSTVSNPLPGGDHKSPASKTELCEACRSFQPGQPNFISHDHEVGISYISTQYPQNSQIFTMVRQACIRSLSCEVCQGREGPIFFGDEHHGYVLSYTFFMKDSHARGFQRWYSIIVVMTDRIFLLNSWPFLVSNMRSLIEELQAKSLKVYEQEQSEHPQRAERINQEFLAPGDFYRRRRGGSKTFRSLLELTSDKNLFRYLHMVFAWILKAGGSRMTEKVLEGPPKEEALIDLDNEEETEEGFIKVSTMTMDPDPVGGIAEGPTAIQDSPEEWQDGGPTFKSLHHLRRLLGSLNFHDLAHHALIGNQIIVRCNFKSTLHSFFEVLKTLLPVGCCHIITYSDHYEESFKCNFLGMSPSTSLPGHVKASEFFILLDIISPSHPPRECERVIVKEADPFHGFGIAMVSTGSLPDKAPTILTKIENILDNRNLNQEVITAFLVALKEEWMNKVKLLFKFTRAGSHTEEETERLLKILKAKPEDKSLLKFWITGLSSQYRSHLLTTSSMGASNS